MRTYCIFFPIDLYLFAMENSAFREWRRRLGLTQKQAAAQLGYGRRWIQAYDDGKADPPRVVVLAMRWLEEHREQ